MPQKSTSMDAVNEVVDTWFAETIQQPPISYSVESYNQAHAARAELKRRLHVLITGEQPPAPEPEPQPAAQAEPAASPTDTETQTADEAADSKE